MYHWIHSYKFEGNEFNLIFEPMYELDAKVIMLELSLPIRNKNKATGMTRICISILFQPFEL